VIALDRTRLRRRSVPHFIRAMAEKHPELRRQVTYAEFTTIAQREGIPIRIGNLSRPARLIRYGNHVEIQLSDRLSHKERTVRGMHELCHYWRDDPGQSCYYADDEVSLPLEEFADIFAWAVTSTARPFVHGLREEDF